MTPFGQLALLVRCALGNEPDPAAAIAAAGLDSVAVIRLALQHRIAPYLYRLAVDPAVAPVLPRDLLGVLTTIHEANADRNARLRRQVEAAVALHNRAGIEPVLLKGAARLVDGTYDDPADRFMRDLDLLVPVERLAEAADILQAAGYRFTEPEAAEAQGHHHLPNLRHEQEEASIELHRAVVHARHARLLPAADIIARSTAVAVGGASARLLAPPDSLLHLVVHGQLQHFRLLSGSLLLQEIVEFVLLARRAGNEALAAAHGQAADAGEGLAFATFLRVSELVTREPLPVAGAQGNASRLLALRSVRQQESRGIRTAGRFAGYVLRAAQVFRHDPTVRRRFPGRLGEAEFYSNRWMEVRRLFRG